MDLPFKQVQERIFVITLASRSGSGRLCSLPALFAITEQFPIRAGSFTFLTRSAKKSALAVSQVATVGERNGNCSQDVQFHLHSRIHQPSWISKDSGGIRNFPVSRKGPAWMRKIPRRRAFCRIQNSSANSAAQAGRGLSFRQS